MFKASSNKGHKTEFYRHNGVAREFSAGGVVYKKLKINNSLRVGETSGSETKFKIVWLVTRSNPSKLYPKAVWRLPKGWIDDEGARAEPGPKARGDVKASEIDLKNAALREVAEEGGVEAKIIKKIATEKYYYTKKESGKRFMKFITFFLMEWKRDLEKGFGFETSEVRWLTFKNASKILLYSEEKRVLSEARAILNGDLELNLI